MTERVRMFVDFNGRPTVNDFQEVFGDTEATMVNAENRFGNMVQRWEAFTDFETRLDFVRQANRHPQVFRVQEANFATELEAF